jgi:hypothetical protein
MNELNPSGLSLGRIVIDTYDLDTIEGIGNAQRTIAATLNAMGGMSPALDATEDPYQNVIYRDGNFYGGNPADPPNPTLLSTAAGGTIIIQEEGVALADPVGTLNFLGATITAVLNGAVADITVTAGSGSLAFGVVEISGGVEDDVTADNDSDTVVFVASTNMTITTNAVDNEVIFASTDTTYSAGDALVLSGTTFNVDLTLIDGYVFEELQFLYHSASGPVEWITAGTC